MTQIDVERALGRLLTDEAFRGLFAKDPVRAARVAGLALNRVELAALAAIPPSELADFEARVDDRIRRLRAPDGAPPKE